MDRQETIDRIKAHEPELRAAGIAALSLFGSTARNEQGDESDVDLMCDLDERQKLGLLEFIGIQLQLEDIVGRRVDLVERAFMRPRIARSASQDMVRVF
jgi:hypothetical protein